LELVSDARSTSSPTVNYYDNIVSINIHMTGKLNENHTDIDAMQTC